MPTPEYFAKYPPFPDDVPTLDLDFISLAKLQAGNERETERLFEACRRIGFFRIDLRDSPTGRELLQSAERLFGISEQLQEMEHEELQPYAFQPPHSLFGYKRTGVLKCEDGAPDRISFYNIGRDEMIGTSAPRANPPLIENERPLFRAFFSQADAVMALMWSRLETSLKLQQGSFSARNRRDQPSGTAVRLLQSAVQPPGTQATHLLGHTDIGSVTLLFNAVGGLQILPPGAANENANWRYVRPEAGFAIVNMADAMVEWSGGVLRSNMHRVTTPPGVQARCCRHSVAYGIRANSNASMKRMGDGAVIPLAVENGADSDLLASDWEAMRSRGIMLGQNLARSTGGGPLAHEQRSAAMAC